MKLPPHMEREVDLMLGETMARLVKELTPKHHGSPKQGRVTYTPHELAQAITLGIGEAVPSIMKLTLLYAHELEKLKEKK